MNTIVVPHGGEAAGLYEVLNTPLPVALEYARSQFRKNDRDLDRELPDFVDNLAVITLLAARGSYTRQQMPVINEEDIPSLEKWLKGRYIEAEKVRAGDLVPMQRQLYLSKAVVNLAKFGVEATKEFLAKTHLFIDSGRIIDGHHRWLSAALIGPATPMLAFEIDEPLRRVIADMDAFSDAEGHIRNN